MRELAIVVVVCLCALAVVSVIADAQHQQPRVELQRCQVGNTNFPASAETCEQIHAAIARRLKHETR